MIRGRTHSWKRSINSSSGLPEKTDVLGDNRSASTRLPNRMAAATTVAISTSTTRVEMRVVQTLPNPTESNHR